MQPDISCYGRFHLNIDCERCWIIEYWAVSTSL